MLVPKSSGWRAASSLILLFALLEPAVAQQPGSPDVAEGKNGGQGDPEGKQPDGKQPHGKQPQGKQPQGKQPQGTQKDQPQGKARGESQGPLEASVADAVTKWLASEQTSETMLADTVALVLAEPKASLPWLGQQLAAARETPSDRRSKNLQSFCSQVILEFLRRAHKSEMVFVGQYDPLAVLEPYASDLLFGLLLDTPDWYPFTFRDRLVAPLRDVHPRQPSVARVDGVVALIEDPQETIGLRNALAAMMAQWGQQEYAQAVVKKLLAATTEGDAEDRVHATLDLADYYNLLRDYERAARAHRTAQALAKGAGVELRPIAWYAAACVYALNGDKERGMEALQECARMHASGDLDRSLRLQRKLFDEDPEIALLRQDPRFAALRKQAFGDAPAHQPDKDGR